MLSAPKGMMSRNRQERGGNPAPIQRNTLLPDTHRPAISKKHHVSIIDGLFLPNQSDTPQNEYPNMALILLSLHRSRPGAKVAVGLAALLVTASPAFAETADIRNSDNSLSVDFGASYLDYAEKQGGVTLDSEKGWQPTVGVGVGILAEDRAAPVLRNLYLRLNGRASAGTTKYDGAMCDQFGNCTSDQGSTDDRIYSLGLQMGRAITLSQTAMLTPFAELGYRHWNRDGLGAGSYSETYGNWDAMGGLMFQYSPVHRWVLSLSGAGGTTFGASMTTGGESFSLGDAAIWRGQGKVGYLVSDRLELTTTAEYQGFSYRASPVDAAGYYEPDSTTNQTTLLVGFAYHFF